MIKSLFGKDNSATGLKNQVEKIHQTILKYADKRSELLIKIDVLKNQRTNEMLASIDAEDVPVSSKIRKQIIEVQEQIEEIEVAGRELLKRKRATIKDYFSKASEEADAEHRKLRASYNIEFDELQKFKKKQEIELKQQEAKCQQASYLSDRKGREIDEFSCKEIKSKYTLSADIRDVVVEDPFFGALPWDWDKALSILEEKKKTQLAEINYHPNRDFQLNCNEEIILDDDGMIKNIDCKASITQIIGGNGNTGFTY